MELTRDQYRTCWLTLAQTLASIELHGLEYDRDVPDMLIYKGIEVTVQLGKFMYASNYSTKSEILWINPKDIELPTKLRVIIKSIDRKHLPF